MSDLWRADGKELHFSADSQDFVGLHTEALPEVIAERHNATAHEAAQWRHANTIAAKAFVQQDAQLIALEAELRQAQAKIVELEAALLQAALMKTIKGARVIVADALRKKKNDLR